MWNVIFRSNRVKVCQKCFRMFPDSVIAKNVTFSKDKCSYYINYGIRSYYKSVLTNEIKTSSHYSLSFDKTLNKVTQQEQMDIYAIF